MCKGLPSCAVAAVQEPEKQPLGVAAATQMKKKSSADACSLGLLFNSIFSFDVRPRFFGPELFLGLCSRDFGRGGASPHLEGTSGVTSRRQHVGPPIRTER